MTNIANYRLADCALLRTPPVDYKAITGSVEQALVDAWQRGTSVDQVVDYLLQDSKLKGKLASQISENLAYQLDVALSTLETRAQTQKQELSAEKDSHLAKIEGDYQQKLDASDKAVEDAYADADAKTAHYTATQARLEELRQKVKSQVGEVGEEQYDRLAEITKAVIAKDSAEESALETITEEIAPKQKKRPLWKKIFLWWYK